MSRHDNAMIDTTRPSVSDLEGDNVYAVTARKNWYQKDKIRFDPKTVTSLFTELERDNWAVKSLLILENLQYVEKLVNSVCDRLKGTLLIILLDIYGQISAKTRRIHTSSLWRLCWI